MLLLAGNLQGQNEDPTCPNPEDCVLFVEAYWKDMNDPAKPDLNKDLRRLIVGPLPEMDSIFIKIGTEREKGEALDTKGKLNIPGRYVDFGKYGIKYMNKENSYNVEIDFDLMQRADKDKFIFLSIRAKDFTDTKRTLWTRQIGQSMATYSITKKELQFTYNLEPTTKLLSLQYFLATANTVTMIIQSINGSIVKNTEINSPQSGHIQKVYNLTGLAAGMYLFQLQLGQTTFTEKITIQ